MERDNVKPVIAKNQASEGPILLLPSTSCMALGNFSSLRVLQFSSPSNKANNAAQDWGRAEDGLSQR